jgi:hypothetical protein
METDDIAAWNFYQREATPFVRKFGLMDARIADVPFDGVARSIFIEKLSAVHGATMERDAREAKDEASGEKPEVVIEGSENG